MSDLDDTAPPSDDQDISPGVLQPGSTGLRGTLGSYAIGLGLSVALTVAAFLLPKTMLVWAPAIPAALVVLAIAQIGVHLVFFLHITTSADNTNNALALAFGVLIVTMIIAGSLWIMAHLNHNMMSIDQIRHLQH